MAITFPITGGTDPYTTATRSPVVSVTSAPAENDIVVTFVAALTTAATTDVSGWTNVLGANTVAMPSDSTCAAVMLYHRVTAEEAAASTTSWTLTNLWNATETGRHVTIVLRGVATSGELVGTGTQSDANLANPFLIASVTPTADDCQIISGVAGDGTQTLTTPSGWTRQVGLGGTQTGYVFSRDALGENGVSTGTTNVTPSGGNEYVSITAAFKPAGATSHAMSASGSTTTGGTAAINAVRPVAAAGSTTTGGSASINATRPVAATGSATTGGSAALVLAYPIAATGTTTTGGTAAINATRPVTASGSATSGGVAAINATRPIAGAGSTSTGGAVAINATRPIAASGSTTTGGAAAVGVARPVTAAGATTTDGAAAIHATRPIAASGTTTTGGSAAIVLVTGGISLPIAASGTVTTGGTAAIALTVPLAAVGSVTSDGAAAIHASCPLVASGSSTLGGDAQIGLLLPVSATGSTTTGGSVTIEIYVPAALQLAAAGQVSMSGRAEISIRGRPISLLSARTAEPVPGPSANPEGSRLSRLR